MKADEEDGLYDNWDNTLMDGLEDEPIEVDVISTNEKEPEIRTVYVEKPVEVVKEVVKEVPVPGIMESINQSSSTVEVDANKNKGPLFQYRTRKDPDDNREDDKNLTKSTD